MLDCGSSIYHMYHECIIRMHHVSRISHLSHGNTNKNDVLTDEKIKQYSKTN